MKKSDLEAVMTRLTALEESNKALKEENEKLQRVRTEDRLAVGGNSEVRKNNRAKIPAGLKLNFDWLKEKWPEKFGHMTFRVVNDEGGGVHNRLADGWQVVELPANEQQNGTYLNRNDGEMQDTVVSKMVGRGVNTNMMNGILMMKPMKHHERDKIQSILDREKAYNEALASGTNVMNEESDERDGFARYVPTVDGGKGNRIEQAIMRERRNG